MLRRHFIQIACVGASAIGVGGFVYLRQRARGAMESRLLDQALPALTSRSDDQLKSLPIRVREEIQRYFDGICLNSQGFVSHICSKEFRDRLGRCRDNEDRELYFTQAFCGRVASEAEILNRVEMIAAEAGGELDSAWASYCAELSSKWDMTIRGSGERLSFDTLTARLGALIQSDLSRAIREGSKRNIAPAVGDTLGKIGQSAVMLLPLVRLGQPGLCVAIPLFVLLAMKPTWDYVSGQLEDPRGNLQAAISGRLALLGRRVGAEFEREVRQRVTDLHSWQESSVRKMAAKLAEERATLI